MTLTGTSEHPWGDTGRDVLRFKEEMEVLRPGMVALSPEGTCPCLSPLASGTPPVPSPQTPPEER